MRQGVREFREDFSDLLKSSDISKLVVIIDDLDRCLPDTIIETLEAIKLFLFVENSAFVIGADERLVKYAVRQRFPELPGENVEVGRDYLEKLIQFPVRVPSLTRSETTNYIGHLFTLGSDFDASVKETLQAKALAGAAEDLDSPFDFQTAASKLQGCPQDLKENLALAERIGPQLAIGLSGNPRQCKRFLNALMMRLQMAKSRSIPLKTTVLAKLMLLEYFKPSFFRTVAEKQSEEEGKPETIKALEEAAEHAHQTPSKTITKTLDEGKRKLVQPSASKDSEQIGDGSEHVPTHKWLNDTWIRTWARMEPKLSGIDLRPYIYFSRDSLTSLNTTSKRLTPQAQEVLQRLFHDSDAIRKQALAEGKSLNEADAAAVLDSITIKIRQEDDLSGDESPLYRLFDWVKVRPELISQLFEALRTIPDRHLPIATVLKTVSIAQGTSFESTCRAQLEKWAKGTKRELAKAAKMQLNPKKNGGK